MSKELAIEGPRPLRGSIRVPGDKSISHRALMFAAVADGACGIRNLADGADVGATRRFVEAMGIRTRDDASLVKVLGAGWDGLREPGDVVDCANSGTTMRVGLGLLAACPFHAVLAGDSSLAARPMLRVVEPLRSMGATIDGRDGGDHAPLAVRGGALEGERRELGVASAQVKTALLLAGLRAEGRTEVVSPSPSRDHTERMLAALGVAIEEADAGRSVGVEAATIPGFDIEVPGDASSAAFFVVGALVSPGSDLTIENVSLNPTRIAYLDVLRRMGADIETEVSGESCGEPSGTIRARTSDLQATLVEGEEVPLVIDEIPALCAAAAFADGVTEVRDAAELVVKESNRIGAVEQELSQLGVEVEAGRDGLVVRGGHPSPGHFKSHGDHRVAMAMAVAANACTGQSLVQGWQAVGVSYPRFADDLARATGSPTPGG